MEKYIKILKLLIFTCTLFIGINLCELYPEAYSPEEGQKIEAFIDKNEDLLSSEEKDNLSEIINKLNKEEAEELLSMYNPNVKYIYQGTENDFVALKEKGLEGYVFLMDADTDLGMFVNKDDAKIYYFHPSGYLELAE